MHLTGSQCPGTAGGIEPATGHKNDIKYISGLYQSVKHIIFANL